MRNTLQLEAKRFIHQNLSNLLHLRKTNLHELQSQDFREKTRALIKKTLQGQPSYQPLHEHEPFIQEILSEALGLGPIEALMKDEDVTEIMVNGPYEIFIEQKGCIQKTNLQFSNEACLRNMISRVVSPLGRRIDEASPMVDARLPDGSRFNAIIPPLSLQGPIVTIRKFLKHALTAQNLIESNSISKAGASFLKMSVATKKNILIAGGTGSGKTTLLNMLSSFIPPSERIVTIEDAAELKLPQPHVVSLESRPENIEGKGQIMIRDLLKNALRMRPDRIIVGECRGAEAIDMLQAMNTGHEGSMTTIHSNSSRDALLRLETLTMMAGYSWPLAAIREQIHSAIDIIVFISRNREGKRGVRSIMEVCGIDHGVILTQELFKEDPNTRTLVFCNMAPRFLRQFSESQRKEWLAHFSSEQR